MVERRAPVRPPALGVDEALIGLFIAATHANGHMSAAEGARANHLIRSMKRFRRRSGEDVGRTIAHMFQFVSEHGAGAVLPSAARVTPGRPRLSASAVTADLLLADGTSEPTEWRSLNSRAADLRLDIDEARSVVDAMLV